jgi:signal transduction histidine kinase/ActR/RegA family two-component response regulator
VKVVVRIARLMLAATGCVLLAGEPAGGVEAQPIGGVRAAAREQRNLGAEVRIRAVVTQPPGNSPGAGKFFYVQDSTGGIAVVPQNRMQLRRWEEVEVRGRLDLYNELEPEVTAAEVVRTGVSAPVQPMALRIEEAVQGREAGRLVAVEGEVLYTSVSEDWELVVIGSRQRAVRLQLRNAAGIPERIERIAARGATVRGRGILVPVADGTFQVRMGTIGDLSLIRRAPLRIPKSVLWAGGLAIFAALLAALWIVTLRRSVKAKTAEAQGLLEKAQEASRLKSEFLANVSHEIRTPMHGILGLQELILGSRLEAEARRQLEVAHKTTASLLTLLNDLLDFSSIEANRLALKPEALDIRAVLRDAVGSFKVAAEEKGLTLRWSVSGDVPALILCDGGRLRQILHNLLSNAVKFTERGEVEAGVRLERLEGRRATVVVSVSDTGPGIPAGQLEAVFEPFRQADGSVARRYGGNGLGLSIAARLAELLGGRLWAESEVGKGSSFHFSVRCEVIESTGGGENSAPAPEAGGHGPGRLRILLVEDNRVNQLVARRLLEKDGHDVALCENGAEAVELAVTREFDAILMDVQMPGVDGLEATRRIRSAESAAGRRIPIVALTAHGFQQDMERCLAAGMDDYLSKPFTPEALSRALSRAARKGGVGGRCDPVE